MRYRADPLVIGGMGGSGTRVFSRIARHAGVFMGEHVDLQEDSRALSPFYSAFTSDFLASGGRVDGALRQRAEEHFAECVEAHLDGLPSPDHPWGVKNPRSILLLPFWHETFPSLRFLHVIRSGLDMAYTEQRNQVRRHGAVLGDVGSTEPERALLWWERVNTTAADYGEAELGDRYLRVRLEDLVRHPKRVTRKIFAFVGADGPLRDAVAEVGQPSTIGRWRQQPDEEVSRLAELGAAALERFGYGAGPASPGER